MYECVAGYGLGGSSIALFGRVGGGIYTKAADVGADMFKLEGLEEDDPRNPAVIADNVGDNVGDIAGMGADLFGSFAESSCATMVVSAASADLSNKWAVMCFPMLIFAGGILVCLITSLFATACFVPKSKSDVGAVLKGQLLISTVLMTPIAYAIVLFAFPTSFEVSNIANVQYWHVFLCIACGLWAGLGIGLITEYYTSNANSPTQELARASETGAATNIILGLALGYQSTILPIFFLAFTIYVSYSYCGMYGVACGALGILSTLAIGLTIDAYGPICDNAGGIAEMSDCPPDVRDNKTDPLDAAGNTTAAIGKGFAIGSAAMVSLSLFGAFVTVKNPDGVPVVDVLDPFVFAGILVGSMLPYWFSAMTMKSVAEAAHAMVLEVKRQFKDLNLLNDPTAQPEYSKCVAISTEASLREMIPPGVLVMLSPLITGYFFGTRALAGLLTGILASGIQVAISASNSGGAWDNAKKYVEEGMIPGHGKKSPLHDATVVGDTVGDPLKDTSGPAINILVKLTAITSLVFASSMPNWDEEGFIKQWLGSSA
jgi:inorganic pyrophosphatase